MAILMVQCGSAILRPVSARGQAVLRAPFKTLCRQQSNFQRGFTQVFTERKSNERRTTRATRGFSNPVLASWGAPVEWSQAKVVANTKAAENMYLVLVDIGELAAGYTKPGQYIQVKVEDSKPGYFAIASPVDSNNRGVVELLIKAQGETAEKLAKSKEGDEVSVSPVQGKGFPMEKVPAAEYDTLLMFCTGSGISPIKALIESGSLEIEKRKSVQLYYGTQSKETTAFADLVPAWEQQGVKVRRVYSVDGNGYVQDVFAKENGITDGQKVGVVLCGQKEMNQALTPMLTEKGVDIDKILLNF